MRQDNVAAYLFHQGTNYKTYEYLGAHQENENMIFRVFAPKADAISLVGDFNNWDDQKTPFTRITEQGVWEAELTNTAFNPDDKYKFKIFKDGNAHYKADPYAFYSETLSRTASILFDPFSYTWHDQTWLYKRKENTAKNGKDSFSIPINIYEVHLGSWRTKNGKTTAGGDAYLNYREIADLLIPYVKKMGYTHIELLPIMEHPYDGSWGYQIGSYFAPTSRFGTPHDFQYFVDQMHGAGIGVILDWVPAHFPKDEHGLYEFDGGPLYEYSNPNKMEHKAWGTRCFDVGRNEVQCFLISNALFWLEIYHIDGLRTDAVASMLYLDYDRKPGEWTPNIHGGNYNLEAIAFFQKLNSAVLTRFPDVMMIAEESTAFPGVTLPPYEGGLGFNFKWNMGWANDMFRYLATDSYFRSGQHNTLTFPMMYAFSERFILPISHDEVVHGKGSLIEKVNAEYQDKFATLRAFFVYLMTMPGKKMLFMGCEYGQFREWDYENQLEWFMTDFETHDKLHYFAAELNHFYLEHKPLWDIDFSWEGFQWINPNDSDKNVISYKRYDRAGHELAVVINFSGSRYPSYLLPADHSDYRIVFYSEESRFGGKGRKKLLCRRNGMLRLNLAPFSAMILKPIRKKENNKPSKLAFLQTERKKHYV
ncbi:MAG: 1,4-alpha-glucan branching protein GlgB [Clostridiales bacterium]|nr:1,4-alpha-glucan branching protein GlgB [Clostridiales bacterium]